MAAADSTDCATNYAANKAQAWLNFEEYAFSEQLPRRVQAAARANVEAILQVLERHTGSALETPELPASRHVRDDLWQGIAAAKGDGRLCAAPKMTAYCEVQLAWVDYEAGAGGWRHADPYVRIAEDYCGTALSVVPLAVHEPEAAAGVVPPPDLPPPPAAPSQSTLPTPRDLSLSVVFPHNRWRRADIRHPGRAEIRALVARMKSLPPKSAVLVVGAADLTGHADYNLRLSEQRARSVAGELRALGIPAARIRLRAVGSSEPIVDCTKNVDAAERRRYLQCLEPNRRVVIELVNDAP
jgi:outer membrane protein OmpA-like peptidoglycan-associated protein